jgi:hypothetical protein
LRLMFSRFGPAHSGIKGFVASEQLGGEGLHGATPTGSPRGLSVASCASYCTTPFLGSLAASCWRQCRRTARSR